MFKVIVILKEIKSNEISFLFLSMQLVYLV